MFDQFTLIIKAAGFLISANLPAAVGATATIAAGTVATIAGLSKAR